MPSVAFPRVLARALKLVLVLSFVSFVSAAEKKNFDLPADSAERSLRRFSTQSGVPVVFSSEIVRGVRTPAVSGAFSPQEAIGRLLAGSGLVVEADEISGSMVVRREPAAREAPANPGTETRRTAPPAPVRPAADASDPAAAAEPDPIELSVFEVAASADDTYGSATSTSITGTRKELRRLPVSAEIMSRALLDDLGALEIREILEFAPGTGAFLLSGGTSDVQGNQPGDRIGTAVGSLRGLSVGTRRNGFLANGSSFDGFSKDRVEIIRGPQALLYGPTNASGIIVLNTKRPSFNRNSLRATVRVDSEGSRRFEGEVNAAGRLPGEDRKQVAVLVSAFDDHSKFWRVNNEIESRGVYLAGAVRLSPRYTLRADFETVRRHAIDPTTIRLSAPANDPVYGSRNNRPLRLLLGQGLAADIFDGQLSFENADSFMTDMFGEIRDSEIFSAQLEARPANWISILVQGGYSHDDRIRYNSSAGTALTPPAVGANPTGEWAVQLAPHVDPIRTREKAWRAIANIDLPRWRFLQNELSIGAETRRSSSRQLAERWFEIDANDEFIRNPAALNNGFSGRTLIPSLWWAPGSQGWDGPEIYQSRPDDVLELNGRRYRRDSVRNAFPQFVTEANPLGFSNGSAGINWTERENHAGFVALSTDWFDGRVDTLVGYRYDILTNSLVPRPFEDREFKKGSYMYGLNWHLTRQLTAYYAHSTSFQPSTGLTSENKTVPEGSGEGDEVGLKFSFLDERFTGGVSFYASKAKNNTANLPTNFQNIVDYVSGVNGRRNGGLAYLFDRETKGYEINLTAAPVRGLRLQASFSHIKANEGADVVLPIFYNDQFNVNASGEITLGPNGTPLLVPVVPNTPNWNPAEPTPGVPTQVLTLDMLRNGDAAGNYRATLDSNSGRITNAGALYLNTPTVGTGVTGLPVAEHQLGFQSPSGPTLIVRQGGDRTTGYATNSFSFTANYRFTEGRMRGFSIGGNYRVALDQLAYYYVDRSDPANPRRLLHTTPDQQFVTVFASYERKFKKRFTFRTQINVSNALDDVSVVTYPNVGNGTAENVRLTNAPRVVAWTNTLRF